MKYGRVKGTENVAPAASNPSLSVNTQNPKVVFNKYQDDNYETIFGRYANQKSEMYAEHLQSLLNDEVITDQSFVADKEQFSLDSCRGMLLLMDNLFKTIDLNQTGFIDRSGLVKAIQDAGLVVSDAVLNIMILRYANYAQKMSFADFVCCMIRLETVTNKAIDEEIMEALTIDDDIMEALTIDDNIMEALTIDDDIMEALTIDDDIMEALTIDDNIMEALTIDVDIMEVLTIEDDIMEALTIDDDIMEALTR
ncbi:unnamed protein product [Ranitomeya imitator]|uniref:Calpain-3/13-like C-terminal EF-hand domain-containing protein n=1 Tax=Ranitomeya imitator TaxID=111125 RepID=A0ABN9LEM9_9NEOB|nr:unnamed protein product [Ranitomeya imitator]